MTVPKPHNYVVKVRIQVEHNDVIKWEPWTIRVSDVGLIHQRILRFYDDYGIIHDYKILSIEDET